MALRWQRVRCCQSSFLTLLFKQTSLGPVSPLAGDRDRNRSCTLKGRICVSTVSIVGGCDAALPKGARADQIGEYFRRRSHRPIEAEAVLTRGPILTDAADGTDGKGRHLRQHRQHRQRLWHRAAPSGTGRPSESRRRKRHRPVPVQAGRRRC
jgi:hypothetical protein